jgi:uncharacterized membrane protein
MTAWTEAELDIRMGRLLQWGITLAASVMLIGAAVYLFHYGKSLPSYRTFRSGTSRLQSLHGILGQAILGDGSGLIQLAVVLIIATPVARVIFAAYAFFRQRDWLYAVISMTVLSLLIYGLVHAA